MLQKAWKRKVTALLILKQTKFRFVKKINDVKYHLLLTEDCPLLLLFINPHFVNK